MAIKKIPCGGFSYDDTEIAFEDGVIHPIGGGGGGAMVVNIYDTADTETETEAITADKTGREIYDAMYTGCVVGNVHVVDGTEQLMIIPIGCGSVLMENGVIRVAFIYQGFDETGQSYTEAFVVDIESNEWDIYTL